MKHMKKSMFITTVFMVVLLIAAVSTATFAWYTSSNTVSTLAATVNSAESTGANISIGWKDTAPAGQSELAFINNDFDYSPLVPVLGGSAFSNATPFYTANLSFGSLINQNATDPYIGTSVDDESTFYVVNFAQAATNVKFKANITGPNAARLRVAVFTEEGILVFTSGSYYTGTVVEAVDTIYTLLETQPSDWADNFADYSTSNTEHVAVVGPVAPVFQENRYYANENDSLGMQVAPADWDTNFAAYSTTNGGIHTPVVGVAPAFEGDIYRITPAVPAHLTTGTAVSPISLNTLIAASPNGFQGTAQGFIVKAWFDGPSQVDAYGGMSANFKLTVDATNVTP